MRNFLGLLSFLLLLCPEVKAVCTTESAGLGLKLPNYGDRGDVYFKCVRDNFDLLNDAVTSTTTAAAYVLKSTPILTGGLVSSSWANFTSSVTASQGFYGALYGNASSATYAVTTSSDSYWNAKVNRSGDSMSGQLTTASSMTAQHVMLNATPNPSIIFNGDNVNNGGELYYKNSAGSTKWKLWHYVPESGGESDRLLLYKSDLSYSQTWSQNGNVGFGLLTPLYKIDTTGGIHAASSITADSGFYGAATGLTAIPAAQLTGTVPTGLVDLSTVTTRFVALESSTAPLVSYPNWNTAYGWGNHASAGYATQANLASTATALASEITRATTRENDIGASTGTIQLSVNAINAALSTAAFTNSTNTWTAAQQFNKSITTVSSITINQPVSAPYGAKIRMNQDADQYAIIEQINGSLTIDAYNTGSSEGIGLNYNSGKGVFIGNDGSGKLLVGDDLLSAYPDMLTVNGTAKFLSSATADGGWYGNLTGAASANVLKAGDTMTGPLTLAGSTLTVGGALGVSAPRIRLASGVSISSEPLAALGAGVNISSNVYIVGFSSATKYYGDGSALTGVSGLPSQTGESGKYLTTDGSDASWASLPGGGDTVLAGTQTFTGQNTFSGVASGVGLWSPGDFKWKISQSSSCGTGWLRADGSSVSTTTYPALFSELGYMYGGSGANFTLPNMNNGEFVRSVSTSATSGWSATTNQGTKQQDAFQGHKFSRLTIGANSFAGNYSVTSSGPNNISLITGSGSEYVMNDIITDGTNGTPRTSIETRPINYPMIPCVYSGVK